MTETGFAHGQPGHREAGTEWEQNKFSCYYYYYYYFTLYKFKILKITLEYIWIISANLPQKLYFCIMPSLLSEDDSYMKCTSTFALELFLIFSVTICKISLVEQRKKITFLDF